MQNNFSKTKFGLLIEICSLNIHFSRWRPRPLNTTSGFVFVDVIAYRRSKSITKHFVQISHMHFSSLSANQISSTYLSWRLRYNYFWFRNTNVRRIGILLPVSISTISPFTACHSASGCRISSKSEQPPLKYDVISRSALRGLNSDLK